MDLDSVKQRYFVVWDSAPFANSDTGSWIRVWSFLPSIIDLQVTIGWNDDDNSPTATPLHFVTLRTSIFRDPTLN